MQAALLVQAALAMSIEVYGIAILLEEQCFPASVVHVYPMNVCCPRAGGVGGGVVGTGVGLAWMLHRHLSELEHGPVFDPSLYLRELLSK